jgi:hypothetical protein
MEHIDILKSVKENMENTYSDEYNPESDQDGEVSENIIIKNFANSDNILSVILAQREVDQKHIIVLNKKINEMDKENSRLDTKLHYTRMDLSNVEIKLETLKQENANFQDKLKKSSTAGREMFFAFISVFVITNSILYAIFL